MSITSVNTWSSGDELTYTQINSLDTKLQTALDKTSAGDTLSGAITCSGVGRIIQTYEAGADSNATYAVADGISVIDARTGLSANRTYTLSTTGAATNDRIVVLGPSATYTLTVGGVVLGTVGAAISTWAEFRYNGSSWELFRTARGSGYKNYTIPFLPEFYSADTQDDNATLETGGTWSAVTGTQIGAGGHYGHTTLLKTVNTGSSESYRYRMWLPPSVLPQGMTLGSIVMTLTGAGAHGGLPQQMPALAAFRVADSEAIESLNTGGSPYWSTDASADVTAYEAEHTITFTCNEQNVIDHSAYRYVLYMLGEGGSNALANLAIRKLVVNLS